MTPEARSPSRKGLLAPLALLCASCATAPQAGFSAEEERLYLERFEKQQQARLVGGGLPEYDPLEMVEGAPDATPLPRAETPSVPAPVLAQARDYAGSMNSSALIVWKDGRIEADAYFGGNTAQSLINSKSLAKPLSAIAVGRAIALGHIRSLDQPAADFLTEWRGDAARERITLRHLLGMRSGLLPQGPTGDDPADILNRAYLHPRHDEVIIREYPLTHEPGERYEYSNANGELIAPIIERATGMRYGDFLSAHLLAPLGAAGGTIFVNREGGTAHSGCCIQLPAETWLRFGILLLQDGQWQGRNLLPEGYVAEMKKTTPSNPHAGLGVWIAGDYVEWRGSLHPSVLVGRTYHSEPYLADDLFLFDGNGKQVVYIVPSRNLVILRTGTFPPKGSEWDNAYLPNLILRAAS